MSVIGAKEVLKAINALPDELERKAYRSALSAGGRIVVKNAKRRIQNNQSKTLKKSLRIKYLKATKRRAPVVIIGPGRGVTGKWKNEKRTRIASKYAHLVEKGTFRTAAKPFLRPAMDESQNAAFSKMAEMVEKVLMKAKGGRR